MSQHWVDHTLAEFGNRLGIAQMALDAQGRASIEFASGQQLVVESIDDAVLVYQVTSLPYPSDALRVRLLRLADFRQGHAFQYQIGLRGTGHEAKVVTLVRLPSREFTLQALERILETLQRHAVEIG